MIMIDCKNIIFSQSTLRAQRKIIESMLSANSVFSVRDFPFVLNNHG